MSLLELSQILVFLVCVAVPVPFLGRFMARVFRGENTFLSPILGPIERLVYRLTGTDQNESMLFGQYLSSLLWFNAAGLVILVALQLLQHLLPLNPAGLGPVPFWLAFNTAVSFVTNTNWQAYSGESTLSYLVQCLGLTVQNFMSAATGIAVFLAIVRGLAKRKSTLIGNFWVDMTRATLYLLLPISFIAAIFLVSQGAVQTFTNYVEALTLEGAKQLIPLGPAASQIAIKQLGTNGGGFFGVNSAHPFENPTALTNLLEMVFILLIPAALTYTFGILVGARRHGTVLLAAMTILFFSALTIGLWAEFQANPALGNLPFLEGKETRFGIANSVIWSQATTVASNGSVNAMHSSLSPIAGGLAMFNVAIGEVVFGGVGAGLYGMLMYVIITVFIAGLMVGRTPEYLGKKIESREVKLASIAVIAPAATVLIFSGVAALTRQGLASLSHHGPHGLSEILYTFLSASNNNGSAFAGLNANTDFYNVTTAIAMLMGRYVVIGAALAIAGSLAAKDYTPPSTGTFPTDKPLFVALLIGVILIIGGLSFFPALTLGPLMEQLLMLQGRTF